MAFGAHFCPGVSVGWCGVASLSLQLAGGLLACRGMMDGTVDEWVGAELIGWLVGWWVGGLAGKWTGRRGLSLVFVQLAASSFVDELVGSILSRGTLINPPFSFFYRRFFLRDHESSMVDDV